MRRATPTEIKRMRQLRRAGFLPSAIGKAMGFDGVTIWLHTKDVDGLKPWEYVRAILPHIPLEGPPFPQGYSLNWEELNRLEADQQKEREKEKEKK